MRRLIMRLKTPLGLSFNFLLLNFRQNTLNKKFWKSCFRKNMIDYGEFKRSMPMIDWSIKLFNKLSRVYIVLLVNTCFVLADAYRCCVETWALNLPLGNRTWTDHSELEGIGLRTLSLENLKHEVKTSW